MFFLLQWPTNPMQYPGERGLEHQLTIPPARNLGVILGDFK